MFNQNHITMKKIIFLLTTVGVLFTSCTESGIEQENKPPLPDLNEETDLCEKMDDMVFIAYCRDNFDANGDGIFTLSEAETVHMIDISNENVFSVKGIEYFKNLNTFRAGIEGSAAPLLSCDLRYNEALTNIYCEGCKDLTEILLPSTISKISEKAFMGCGNMAEITIPESVAEIGRDAFMNCYRIESITIPQKLVAVGPSAFYNSGIKEVYISDLLAWCRIAFSSPDANPLFGGATLHLDNMEITDLKIPSEITTVKANAFYGCSSLTSVTIHRGVLEIGLNAFDNCTNLSTIHFEGTTPPEIIASSALPTNAGMSITIPEGSGEAYLDSSLSKYHKELLLERYREDISASRKIEYTTTDGTILPFSNQEVVFHAYNDGKGIIVFADAITEIEENMFREKNTLQTITIPDGVTLIADQAFYHCSNLISANIPDSVTTIGDNAFSGSGLTSVNIPESVTAIGDNAFSGSGLTSLMIPNSVTYIGQLVFYDCDALESVVIGDGVAEIGVHAFSNCDVLKSAVIGDGVTKISQRAFSGCKSLESVSIGQNVIKIEESAFDNCTSLQSLTIPDSVVKIYDHAFRSCSGLKDTYIGCGVTYISRHAFEFCTGELVVNCNIPSTDRDSRSSFSGSHFSKITIGNNVTSIGKNSFQDNSKLIELIIPDSVTTIGEEAFYDCRSLSKVYFKSQLPPEINQHAFYYRDSFGVYKPIDCIFYVPTAAVEEYEKAGLTNIVGYDF